MHTVSLFAALFLGNPLVNLGEMNVPAGLLLAFVPFGADLIELLVIPAIAFEAADVVKASLVVDPCGQSLDAQVKGDDPILAHGAGLPFLSLLAGLVFISLVLLLRIVIDERTVVVSPCIPGHRYLVKMLRRRFGEMRDDVGKAFVTAFASCRKHNRIALCV